MTGLKQRAGRSDRSVLDRHAILRPTASEDLEFVLAAERVEENRRFIVMWTRDQHEAALADPDLLHAIVEDDRQVRVGFLILAGLTSPSKNVEFRRLVITEKSQGFGRAAVRGVLQFSFGMLRAHRLWLDVKEDNLLARQLYAEEGFFDEGVLRECLIGPDGYESLRVMSILEREYHGRVVAARRRCTVEAGVEVIERARVVLSAPRG